MKIALRWIDPNTCEFVAGERTLARYSAAPGGPASESPKPCLHPVRTLDGEEVTAYRPADHPWHHGIAWAFTYIDAMTFWGGPTYQRETASYVWKQNHGRQEHRAWLPSDRESTAGAINEELEWLSPTGTAVLLERRRITGYLPASDCWRLSFASEFTNPADQSISLESPVCHGRPEGGYFGLMWRGAPAWAFGEILSADPEAAAVMGSSSPWIAYRQPAAGPTPGTVLFVDHPSNPRFPTQWFARCQDQPLASFALAYDQPLILKAGGKLALRYDLVIFNGRVDRDRLERAAAAVVTGSLAH